jgi:response regulator RpfG family c-di-GMP phosphodiesterase
MSAVAASTKLRILCVDDEPRVLEGLKLQLRRGFEVSTAASGAEALAAMSAGEPFPVIMSDMRMPGMDGATFLARARELSPDSVRLLLSGQSDLEAAIRVINEGQIFRFLNKPCSPEAMLATLEAARKQYELIVGERVLLEETLRGCIAALVDVLGMSQPLAFGRATRIKQRIAELSKELPSKARWPIEVAAMVSQLGCMSLADDVVGRIYGGDKLDERDLAIVLRLPAAASKLLAHIPRLEPVRAILDEQHHRYGGAGGQGEAIPIGARMLRIATDADILEAQGLDPQGMISILRGRAGDYDPALLEALAARLGAQTADDVRELALTALCAGMVLVEDLRLKNGPLLVARGFEVTSQLLLRIKNFDDRQLPRTIKVRTGSKGG